MLAAGCRRRLNVLVLERLCAAARNQVDRLLGLRRLEQHILERVMSGLKKLSWRQQAAGSVCMAHCSTSSSDRKPSLREFLPPLRPCTSAKVEGDPVVIVNVNT